MDEKLGTYLVMGKDCTSPNIPRETYKADLIAEATNLTLRPRNRRLPARTIPYDHIRTVTWGSGPAPTLEAKALWLFLAVETVLIVPTVVSVLRLEDNYVYITYTDLPHELSTTLALYTGFGWGEGAKTLVRKILAAKGNARITLTGVFAPHT